MSTGKFFDFLRIARVNGAENWDGLPIEFGSGDFLELAGIGLWIFNIDGRITYANKAIAKILGYSPEEMLAIPQATFIGQGELGFDRRMQPQGEREGPEKFEARLVHRNGSEVWADVSSIPLFNQEAFLGTAFILIDATERKREHAACVRDSELLKTIVRSTEDIIYIKDSHGRYLMVNEASRQALGYSPEEIVGKTVSDFDLSLMNSEVELEDQSILQTGVPLTVERALTVNEEKRIFSMTKSPCRSADGDIIGVIGISRDITKLKLSEQALQKSEESYRTILENIQDGYFECNLSGMVTFCNDAFCRIHGYSRDACHSTDYRDYLTPENARRTFDAFHQVYLTGVPLPSLEIEVISPNGKIRYLDESVSLMRDAQGKAVGFRGIVRDMTERKEAEEKLRRSEERYRTILESINDGYFETTLSGRLAFVNEGLVKMFGHRSKDELVGLELSQFTQEPYTSQLRSLAAVTHQTGEPTPSFVYELRRLDGVVCSVDMSVALMRDNQGKAVGFHGIIRDVTERNRAELALRASEERFSKAFNACPEPMCLVTLEEGRFLQINEAWEQCYGLSREKLIGRTTSELNLAQYPMSRQQFVEWVKKEGHISDWEVSGEMKDGQTHTFLVSIELIELDGQKVILSVSKDITERKRMEELLRASEERFAKAFLSSPQPMAILELPLRRYAHVNEALVKSAGWTKEEMIGRTPNDLNVWISSADAEQVANLFAEQGTIRNLETKFRTKTGEIRDFLYSAEGITFDGKPYVLIVANDITDRKRAEESLQQNEALLRSIIESSPDWIFVKDLNHRYKLVNQTYADALHMKIEDFIGKNDLELGFPEDYVKGNPEKGIKGFWPADRDVFSTGQPQFIDEDPVEIDGQTHIFNTIKVPLKKEEGRVWGVLGVGRDLTKLKRVEAALRASEERFAKAFNASPLPMVIFKASSRRIVSVNKAMVRVFGWSEEEMVGKTPADLSFWVDLNQQQKVRELLASQGFVREKEIQFRAKSGDVREFLYSAETVILENSPHALVVVSDITERRKAERALQESEERYRLLFEHGFAGISRSTLDGRILDCNDTAAQVLGYQSADDLLRVNTTNLYFDREHQDKLIDELLRSGSVKNYERRMRRKDGTPVWTLCNITLVNPSNGSAPILEGVLLDITKRKMVEQELAQSYEQLRSLSARVDKVREEERKRMAREIHDNLGQMLTGLKMEFSWLDRNLSRTTDDALRSKTAPKLKEIAQLLEETIQTVRDIATELRPGLLDTLGLCAAMDWHAHAFGQRSNIKCRTTFCAEPRLPSDCSTALFRIFQEILTNIARHAKATRFTVDLAETEGDLVLTVTDDGVGITKEQLYDPTSLGLIGMRERVSAFGGDLRIEGAPDKGTTVTVTILGYLDMSQNVISPQDENGPNFRRTKNFI